MADIGELEEATPAIVIPIEQPITTDAPPAAAPKKPAVKEPVKEPVPA